MKSLEYPFEIDWPFLEGKRPARLEQVAEELARKKKLGKKEGIEFDEA